MAAPMFLPAMQAAAPRMKIALAPIFVRSLPEIERAVTDTASKPAGAVIVLPDSGRIQQAVEIADHRQQRRLVICI